jgi:hypothetical protein
VDGSQTRIRKRGETGWIVFSFLISNCFLDDSYDFLLADYTYTVTTRQYKNNQKVETRRDISYREYEMLKGHKDFNIDTITKIRRGFIWDNQYFHMDFYQHPRPGLVLLEAYMPATAASSLASLPPFLKIDREVTSDDEFSMFNLSKKMSKEHHHHHHQHHHREGSAQANGHQHAAVASDAKGSN